MHALADGFSDAFADVDTPPMCGDGRSSRLRWLSPGEYRRNDVLVRPQTGPFGCQGDLCIALIMAIAESERAEANADRPHCTRSQRIVQSEMQHDFLDFRAANRMQWRRLRDIKTALADMYSQPAYPSDHW